MVANSATAGASAIGEVPARSSSPPAGEDVTTATRDRRGPRGSWRGAAMSGGRCGPDKAVHVDDPDHRPRRSRLAGAADAHPMTDSAAARGCPARRRGHSTGHNKKGGRCRPLKVTNRRAFHMNSKPTPTLQAVQPSDPGPATLDPFDPANLRLDQSFTETAPVKKLLRQFPCVSQARKISCGCTWPPNFAKTSRSWKSRASGEIHRHGRSRPRACRRVRNENSIPCDQSAGHALLLADPPSCSGRPRFGLVEIRPGGRRIGDEILGARARQHGRGCL